MSSARELCGRSCSSEQESEKVPILPTCEVKLGDLTTPANATNANGSDEAVFEGNTNGCDISLMKHELEEEFFSSFEVDDESRNEE